MVIGLNVHNNIMTDKTIDMTDDENILELYHRISENEQELRDILTIDGGDTKIDNLDLQLVEKLEWEPSQNGEFTFKIEDNNKHTVEIEGISPDSTVLQYFATQVSGGDEKWPNDINDDSNIFLTEEESNSTLSDNSESIYFTGVEGGKLNSPDDFEGNGLNNFTVEVTIEYTDSEMNVICGSINDSTDMVFSLRTNRNENRESDEGNLEVRMRDQNGDEFVFAFESNPNLNDGNRQDITVIIEDAESHEAKLILNGEQKPISIGISESPSNWGSWGYDMGIMGRNTRGNMDNNLNGKIGALRWHDENINEQTINNY